jgi:hypothetical protein
LNHPVVQQLLQTQVVARLAYTWQDGTPRVVPIAFHWSGREIVLAQHRTLRPGAGLGIKRTTHLGALIGRIHAFAAQLEPSEGFVLPHWETDIPYRIHLFFVSTWAIQMDTYERPTNALLSTRVCSAGQYARVVLWRLLFYLLIALN